MGGSDTYCAICGGPLGPVVFDDEDQTWLEEHQILDRTIANPTTTEWLSRARVMSENPDAGSMSKVFVSGSAKEDDSGFFDLVAGDDPTFPAGLDSLRVYDWEADHPLAFPFHEDCYNLLQAKIGRFSFNTGVLYQTFSNHLHGSVPQVLTLDWGVLAELQDQYFNTRKGTEYLLLCPTDIPFLQEYYSALPRIPAPVYSNKNTAKKADRSAHADIFAALPAELSFMILDELPLTDFLALRQASAAVCDLDITQSFWRRRIARDLPWLYDIPHEEWANASTDWVSVYKDLYAASQLKHERSILALGNRRRIWTTMDQIMDSYYAELSRVRAGDISEILRDAKAGNMSLLHRHGSGRSQQPSVQRSIVGLLNNFSDTADVIPWIRVYWNATGSVSGFHISYEPSSTDQSRDTIGDAAHFATFEDVSMPRDDWLSEITLITKGSLAAPLQGARSWSEERQLVGLEFSFARQDAIQVGASDGDRRVLRPATGNVIVGLMGDYCAQGQISKLAILEQPRDRFSVECGRIIYAAGRTRNDKAEALLWRIDMPDLRLVLSEQQKGYWGFDVKLDLLPHEALIFAENDAELASITSVSGDVHMGGFTITYSNREPRSIGPRHDLMRSMSIDSAHGERIVCITSHVEHIVRGIQFITNRGCRLLIGLTGHNQTARRYSASELGGRELAGMYCSWLNRTVPDSRLETFGVLSEDRGSHPPSPTMDASMDSHDYLWDPLPPPVDVTEDGRLWGEWSYQLPHGHRESFPRRGCVVSWLDCTRRVEEVEVVLCHPEHQQRSNVVGIAFQYADGERERVAIGYTELMPTEEPSPEDFRGWCQCRRGQSKPYPDDGPHFWSERWKTGRIAGLTSFLDKHGALSSIQFTDRAGNQSPVWGFKSDDGTSDHIVFEGSGINAKTVGIKFFMNDNNRHVTYDDVVIVGLQALVRV